MKRRSFLGALVVGLVAFASPAHAQANKPLLVYAASSLTDALNQAADAYVATGRPRPTLSYAASSALARQIEQGAKADLFISADEPWMEYLAERNLIDPATRVSFLSNKLVLVSPADRPLTVKIAKGFNLKAALGGGKLAMANPDSVPAGRYGKAALEALGAWKAVEPDVARAENVRAALRFVETGDAAAGIVYLTDARAAGNRIAIAGEFPQSSFPTISYPLAAVRGGQVEEARAFATFLRGSKARAIFMAQGFVLP